MAERFDSGLADGHPLRRGTAVRKQTAEWTRRQGILDRYFHLFDLNRNGVVDFRELQQVMVVLGRRKHDIPALMLWSEWRDEVKQDGGAEACEGGSLDNMDSPTFTEVMQELMKDFGAEDFDDAMGSCDDLLHELHHLTQGTQRGRVLWELFKKWDFNSNGMLKMTELEAVVECSKERYELDETEESRVSPGMTFPRFYEFFLNEMLPVDDDGTFYKLVGKCVERIDRVRRFMAVNDVKKGWGKRDAQLSVIEGGGKLTDIAGVRQELNVTTPSKRTVHSPMKGGQHSHRKAMSPRHGGACESPLRSSAMTPLQKEVALQAAVFAARSPGAESPRQEAKRVASQLRLAQRHEGGSPLLVAGSVPATPGTSYTYSPRGGQQQELTLEDVALLAAEAAPASPGRLAARARTPQQYAADQLFGRWASPSRSASRSPIREVVASSRVAATPPKTSPRTSSTSRRGVVHHSQRLDDDEHDLMEQNVERSWERTRKRNANANSRVLQTGIQASGWGWQPDDATAEQRRATQGLGPAVTRYDGYDRSAQIAKLSREIQPVVERRAVERAGMAARAELASRQTAVNAALETNQAV